MTYCFSNLVGAPFGSAPVQRLALVDDKVERPYRLLHGRQPVGPVGVHNIDILEAETLKRRVESLDNVLSRKAVVIDEDLAVDGAPVDFCRQLA